MEEKILFKGTFSGHHGLIVGSMFLGVLVFFIGVKFVEWDVLFFIEAIANMYGEVLFLVGSLACFAFSIYLYMIEKNCELVITNKKIVGQSAFRKKISLPVEKISSVKIDVFKRLSIFTSSGNVAFWMLTNGEEAWKIIDDLIVDRNNKGTV